MVEFDKDDRAFILELVRDAHTHGILAIEYRGLKLTLRPIANNALKPQGYAAKWSTTLKVPENG